MPRHPHPDCGTIDSLSTTRVTRCITILLEGIAAIKSQHDLNFVFMASVTYSHWAHLLSLCSLGDFIWAILYWMEAMKQKIIITTIIWMHLLTPANSKWLRWRVQGLDIKMIATRCSHLRYERHSWVHTATSLEWADLYKKAFCKVANLSCKSKNISLLPSSEDSVPQTVLDYQIPGLPWRQARDRKRQDVLHLPLEKKFKRN